MFDSCKLIIHNNFANIAHAVTLLESVATSLKFTKKEIFHLSFALEETLTNTIENSFDQDEIAEITIEIKSIGSGIEIIVRDKGLPYNPFRKNQSEETNLSLDASREEISERLIHNLVSSAVFHNLGKQGKEAKLVMYSENFRINNLINEEHKNKEPELDDSYDKVRLFKDEDAYEVSKLFYKSYGYSYVNEIVYFPERIIENVREGKMHSVLSISKKNKIIGHGALFESANNKNISEWGMAVSDPAYRGQGLMNFNVDFLIEHAKAVGYKAIFAHSVTNHPFTQKICAKKDFVTCALLVGYAPNLSFKKIHAELTQRESTYIEVKSFTKPETVSIYLPEKYSEIISEIYGDLGVTINSKEINLNSVNEKEHEISEEFVSILNSADIYVKRISNNSIEFLKRITKHYCVNKVDNIFLFLDMEDESSMAAIPAIEEAGYFFSGVFPYYYFRHTLVMQYINNQKYDYDKITSYSDIAIKIKEIVKVSDPNLI